MKLGTLFGEERRMFGNDRKGMKVWTVEIPGVAAQFATPKIQAEHCKFLEFGGVAFVNTTLGGDEVVVQAFAPGEWLTVSLHED